MKKIDNYIVYGGLLVGMIFVCFKLAYAATIPAPTVFKITNALPYNTKLSLSWTLPAHYTASPPDSADIIWFSGSDTLFLAQPATVTALTKNITNANPGTKYTLALRLRRGDSTVVSNKDTLYTSNVQIENPSLVPESMYMRGARAWDESNIDYDSLYVSTAAGLDSSMVYNTKPYVAIQAKAMGETDSCKILLYIFNGHSEMTNLTRQVASTQNGKWEFINTYADTMNITYVGWTKPKLLNIDSGDHFYVRADGQTNNGNETKLLLRLYRRE